MGTNMKTQKLNSIQSIFIQQKMKKIFNDFITSKKQILAISSPYGTGETYIFKKFIPDFKKILFITYSQSLANSLFNELENEGFKNYNDLTNDEIQTAERLIIQLDNFHD